MISAANTAQHARAGRRRLTPTTLTLSALALVCLSACNGGSPEQVRISGATMGTTYQVTLAAPLAKLSAEQLRQRVESVLDRVNGQMSTYRADSELTHLNKADAGEWVEVSEALLALLKQSRTINTETGGAFDPTLGPLVNLWGFGPESQRSEAPPDDAIEAQLARTGFRNFILRDAPAAVSKRNKDAYLDLSAIAKGHGVDEVAALLRQLGAADYLVEIGGELYGQGNNRSGEPWTIAVERPQSGPRSVQLVVGLQNQGMATSGGYRNYFESEGERFSHTLDPRTGRPVTHDLRAVTVIAESAARADALATALLVMGEAAGLEFAKQAELAALFISGGPDEYTERMTTQFSAQVSAKP